MRLVSVAPSFPLAQESEEGVPTDKVK